MQGLVWELNILIALENSLHSYRKEKKKGKIDKEKKKRKKEEKRKKERKKEEKKEKKKKKKKKEKNPEKGENSPSIHCSDMCFQCLYERCLCSCFMIYEGKSRNINSVG